MSRLKVVLTTRPVWLLLVAMAVALAIGLLIPVDENMRGPLVDVNDAILIAVVVALGGMIAQLYLRVGKLEEGQRDLREENRKLREDNEAIRNDFRAGVTFIDRIGLWLAAGAQPSKRPRPPQQLTDHIDAELWRYDDDPAIGGTTAD